MDREERIVMLRQLSADEQVRQEAFIVKKDSMMKLLPWVMQDVRV